MIIISGPGRSGTSVLAQFCRRMGYDPGGDWYNSVNAGLEDPAVVRINTALYEEIRRHGRVTATLARYGEEMRSLDLAVVKDPRFTFHPGILLAWWSVRTDIRVLLTYRHPEHCIASRKRHSRDLMHRHKTHPDVLRCDFADTVETLLEHEIRHTMLLFPQFLNQYETVYSAFEELGWKLDYQEGRAVWASLVDSQKVHFRASSPLEKAGALKVSRKLYWSDLALALPPLGRRGKALGLAALLCAVGFTCRSRTAPGDEKEMPPLHRMTAYAPPAPGNQDRSNTEFTPAVRRSIPVPIRKVFPARGSAADPTW